jgi:hypothetical protein
VVFADRYGGPGILELTKVKRRPTALGRNFERILAPCDSLTQSAEKF